MFLLTSYKHLQEAAATFHIKAFGVFCARGRRGDLVQQINFFILGAYTNPQQRSSAASL